jgi:putative membrane protein
MQPAATVVVVLVALLHVYILILEMFLWQTPRGLRSFGTTPETARSSAKLAANQGLYNGFLAAGLLFALIWADRPALIFFLACIVVAGLYGGLTVNRRIIVVQAAPAVLALVLVGLSGG